MDQTHDQEHIEYKDHMFTGKKTDLLLNTNQESNSTAQTSNLDNFAELYRPTTNNAESAEHCS